MKVRDLMQGQTNPVLNEDIMTIEDMSKLCEQFIKAGKGRLPIVGSVFDKNDHPLGYRYIANQSEYDVQHASFVYLDLLDGETDSEIFAILEVKH